MHCRWLIMAEKPMQQPGEPPTGIGTAEGSMSSPLPRREEVEETMFTPVSVVNGKHS